MAQHNERRLEKVLRSGTVCVSIQVDVAEGTRMVCLYDGAKQCGRLCMSYSR